MRKFSRSQVWRIVGLLAFLGLWTFSGSAMAEWTFNWETRTDPDGKPIGIYETTPCPIDENTTSYTITNDEGSITYYLGTKYYVDGGYTGGTKNGSWAQPWTTLAQALSNVTAGNKTIIVRGAHDGFSGIYTETGLSLRSGTDDTHRYMVVGYGQERPIINGVSTTADTFSAGSNCAYATLQRLKIQDNYRNGVRCGPDDSYINVFDVWLYNNNKWDFTNNVVYGDGNLYFLGSDYCYIRHCLSERSYGHAYKVGDGADYPTVEWSIAREFGYWEGIPLTSWYGSHPSGFDFPCDDSSYVERGIKLRYNICHTGQYYGVQIRTRTHGGHIIKYNEIYDTPHFQDFPGASDHAITPNQICLYTSGGADVFNNIIRDPGDTNARGLYITDVNTGTVRVYNNLFYNNIYDIYIRTAAAPIECYNNSIYSSNSYDLINSDSAAVLTLKNNVLYQAGSGRCVSIPSGSTHTHNRYYAPSGSIGITLGTGETSGNPNWLALPSGTYNSSMFRLQASLPGTSLSSLFTDDFVATVRTAWDVGAIEYSTVPPGTPTTTPTATMTPEPTATPQPTPTSGPPAPPRNVRIE